jgi:hypothetical protein
LEAGFGTLKLYLFIGLGEFGTLSAFSSLRSVIRLCFANPYQYIEELFIMRYNNLIALRNNLFSRQRIPKRKAKATESAETVTKLIF